MKWIGILLLLVGLFLAVIGFAGAVACFMYPGSSPMCQLADVKYQGADAAMKKYEAAKGSPGEELERKMAMEALDDARATQEECNKIKSTYRTYAAVLGIFGVIGGVFTFGGIGLFFAGRRKKKASATT